jgi:hypothetical protein
MYLDKKFSELTEQDYVSIHLHGGTIPYGEAVSRLTDCNILTTTGTLLGELRHADAMNNSTSLVPLICSFAVLDQLGKCYSHNQKELYPDTHASCIKQCLYYFCDFNANDQNTKALYALRNALLHDSSLVSKPTNRNEYYVFRYSYSQDTLMKHAETAWNGEFSTLCNKNITFVNPKKLLELTESAYTKIFELYKQGKINLNLPEGGREIAYRYLLTLHD